MSLTVYIKHLAIIFLITFLYCHTAFAGNEITQHIRTLPSAHLSQINTLNQEQRSGAYVLEKGEESLLTRAWLSEQAQHSIDVQYFIWSSDNIGILATEALLKAADRGVQIRVIVDDLLIDADDSTLLALSAHPKVSIKVYNPQHTVGTSFFDRILNLITGFRKANQRMHDKVVLVDNSVAVIGGRNMADEYYDYDHEYNFRDRDVLLAGTVTRDIKKSFDTFWDSSLSVSINNLLEKDQQTLTTEQINLVYQQLHEYAQNPGNFAPQVKEMLASMGRRMQSIFDNLVWTDAQFINDVPGKNRSEVLDGGGQSTSKLVAAVKRARKKITIQSPYLVLPEGGDTIFTELIKKGVAININTNSLSSTDNLYAFSGYLNQRESLLKLGINIFEFKPYPAIQKQLINRFPELKKKAPIFAIHAKTMVIDGETLFIGTFNLDPRSAHLNTEVGALIHSPVLAQQVEQHIERDMHPDNSWNAANDNPDSHASWIKRIKAYLFSLLPLEPLL